MLSLRLKTLLDLCVPGEALWDLCCDHGLLGLEALERGHSEVVFNDAVEHVLVELSERIPNEMRHRTRVVHSPAESLEGPIEGNVVLAGVGGEKIFKILSSHISAGRLRAQRLLLCPEKDAQWLRERSFPGFELSEAIEIPHVRGTRWIYRLDACSPSRDFVRN